MLQRRLVVALQAPVGLVLLPEPARRAQAQGRALPQALLQALPQALLQALPPRQPHTPRLLSTKWSSLMRDQITWKFSYC